jgi:hypothetical protein
MRTGGIAAFDLGAVELDPEHARLVLEQGPHGVRSYPPPLRDLLDHILPGDLPEFVTRRNDGYRLVVVDDLQRACRCSGVEGAGEFWRFVVFVFHDDGPPLINPSARAWS